LLDGVITPRGGIVSVTNLKKRFNLEETETRSNSRIITVNIREKHIGFVVDDASQVFTLDEQNIEETPEIITGIEKKYIVGIGKINEKIIIILDLVQILSENEKNEMIKLETNE